MERNQPQPSNIAGLHDFLDHQLDQISAQLQGLARTRDRLQALLDAVMAVSRELELPVVLERIVTAAMDLVQARYGALGVLDEQGTGLAHFIPVGLSAQERADLDDVESPRGRGLLGTLIRRPEPLRVQEISSHPHSAGFPPGHPPMRSFLGVAISVRGEVYGTFTWPTGVTGSPSMRMTRTSSLHLPGPPEWPSKTRACSSMPGQAVSCSCCRRCPTCGRMRAPPCTGRRPPRHGSVVTGTTPFCSRTGHAQPSSAMSADMT